MVLNFSNNINIRFQLDATKFTLLIYTYWIQFCCSEIKKNGNIRIYLKCVEN